MSALALLPLTAALVALASRAHGPRRLSEGVRFALAGAGVHVAVAGAYGVMTLPFGGSLAFASVCAAAMLAAAALVVWVSHAHLDDADDDGRGGRGPGDQPPSAPFDWDARERELREHMERSPELVAS